MSACDGMHDGEPVQTLFTYALDLYKINDMSRHLPGCAYHHVHTIIYSGRRGRWAGQPVSSMVASVSSHDVLASLL